MASSIRIELNHAGMAALAGSGEVASFLESKAEAVLSAAQAAAPVDSGAYRDSLRVEVDNTDRAVARVTSNVDYAMVVEANTGTLARSLDAAR